MKNIFIGAIIFGFALGYAFPLHAAEASGSIANFPKWTRVMRAEHVRPNHAQEGLDVELLLRQAGQRYAGVAYREDSDLFGVPDYWQTRAELLKHNAGDCEDFAIAAYFDLLEEGVPEKLLHIVVVYDRATRVLHAYLQADQLVLDRREGWSVISAHDAAVKYAPIYSINRKGWQNLCSAADCGSAGKK